MDKNILSELLISQFELYDPQKDPLAELRHFIISRGLFRSGSGEEQKFVERLKQFLPSQISLSYIDQNPIQIRRGENGRDTSCFYVEFASSEWNSSHLNDGDPLDDLIGEVTRM